MEDKIKEKYSKEAFDKFTMPISNHLLDEDLTLLWATPPFFNLFTTVNENTKTSLKELLINEPKSYNRLRNILNDAKSTEQNNTICDICIDQKKQTWVRVNASLLDKEITLSYIDISDIKQTYENIKEDHTADFEWMLSEYGGNAYISDMETYELLYVNPISCQTLKSDAHKLIGRKCYEAIQGRKDPCPFCTNKYLKPDETYAWEFFNPSLQQTFMIRNRIINWYGRKARVELSYDMYSAEYKLAKKDQEREVIIKTIPGGLVRVDANDLNSVLWYSGSFLDMVGYTDEQFRTELNSSCGYLHPEGMKKAYELSKTLIHTGDNGVFESPITTRDGKEIILTITLVYVSAEDSWDGIASFYSVGLDVTDERKEQERQRVALQEAYESARIASDAKTNFLSSMSHDIRTPMNAIMGMAMIAQSNMDSPDKVKNCLNKINVSSRHLLSLINEVLDMAKIESGKIDLIMETVDLSELIQNIYDISKSLTTSKQQEFNIIVENVKHEKITTDGDRLRQVFMNLISNAVKYTDTGGHISLFIRESESLVAGKGYFEFIFTDDGIGMSEEFLPHLFEPFSRAEDSRISKIQGTGLGLAITENIIRMMNGTIEVQSELGKGSRFTISIPMHYQEEEEKLDQELIGQSVLIVDDDKDVCENAVLLLNELGIVGKWVLNGYDAINYVEDTFNKKEKIFAIILDWKMPDLDGLDTLKLLRKKFKKDVPIIIVSAYDLSDIEEDFINAGADAFISKPLFKSKMLHVLESFCTSNILTNPNPVNEEKPYGLVGLRVLLVEDNELNREIAEELLSMQGILIETATNGLEAVEQFKQSEKGHYSAILMDIQMPVMNGYEATKQIRALTREDAQDIPIIALTANVFVTDAMAAKAAGMNDHIAKPINIDNLMNILQIHIKEKN